MAKRLIFALAWACLAVGSVALLSAVVINTVHTTDLAYLGAIFFCAGVIALSQHATGVR